MQAMVQMYCRAHHGGPQLCEECQKLLDYAHLRLDRCPFGDDKATCVKCPIHCYKPEPRERVRQVMRFAGPRMHWRHPILAVLHLWDERLGSSPKGTQRAKTEPPSLVGVAKREDSA
ncbi:MAG: nitrous oxide-stimulated promoter family protein [Thermoanaerobaculum sp.]